ncbi:MAG: hypothetical protein AMXMBFR84_16500 [Candidatus Hydrogenedentota bacterium]
MNSKLLMVAVCVVLGLFLVVPLVARQRSGSSATGSGEQSVPGKQQHTDAEYAKEFTKMLSQLDSIRNFDAIKIDIEKKIGTAYLSNSNASMSRGIDGLCAVLFEVVGLNARIALMEDRSEVICFEFKPAVPRGFTYRVSAGDTQNLERVPNDTLREGLDKNTFVPLLYPVRISAQGLTELDPDPLVYYQFEPFEAKQFVRSSKIVFMDELQSINARMREKGLKPTY